MPTRRPPGPAWSRAWLSRAPAPWRRPARAAARRPPARPRARIFVSARASAYHLEGDHQLHARPVDRDPVLDPRLVLVFPDGVLGGALEVSLGIGVENLDVLGRA